MAVNVTMSGAGIVIEDSINLSIRMVSNFAAQGGGKRTLSASTLRDQLLQCLVKSDLFKSILCQGVDAISNRNSNIDFPPGCKGNQAVKQD
ncbi:hypothetical protein HAX54_027750 [Datura stramonium]|uniref:Uncharacterized protein n=1 Tax=Datura stramonium TaxID=4076 RepID=A0ABS8V690_DATST|nr:hypothetical protein [Datura stramonium]